MITVGEPNFSEACGTTRNYSGKGMSQRGAIRWTLGKVCPDGTGTAWPVKWDDYRQILAHYYTGVNFLTDNSQAKFAPDDRWNLLKYELPNGAMATAGANFMVNVTLQNTSSASVPAWDDIELGYQWIYGRMAIGDHGSKWNIRKHNSAPPCGNDRAVTQHIRAINGSISSKNYRPA
jgi:hypothetical protein